MTEDELPDAWKPKRAEVAPLPVLAARCRERMGPRADADYLDELDRSPFAASPEPRPDAQTKQGR